MTGILTDPETGDMLASGGTLAIGDTAGQTAEFVLTANRGEFKEHPLIGAGIEQMTNGIPSPMWCAETKDMLQSCGLPVAQVKIENNIITVE